MEKFIDFSSKCNFISRCYYFRMYALHKDRRRLRASERASELAPCIERNALMHVVVITIDVIVFVVSIGCVRFVVGRLVMTCVMGSCQGLCVTFGALLLPSSNYPGNVL